MALTDPGKEFETTVVYGRTEVKTSADVIAALKGVPAEDQEREAQYLIYMFKSWSKGPEAKFRTMKLLRERLIPAMQHSSDARIRELSLITLASTFTPENAGNVGVDGPMPPEFFEIAQHLRDDSAPPVRRALAKAIARDESEEITKIRVALDASVIGDENANDGEKSRALADLRQIKPSLAIAAAPALLKCVKSQGQKVPFLCLQQIGLMIDQDPGLREKIAELKGDPSLSDMVKANLVHY